MRTAPKTFEDWAVWKKAPAFVWSTCRFTDTLPKAELYGLSSQFRRAAVSIAANLAEGFRKQGRADKARFFNIAQGALEECRYYLILARDLGCGDVSARMPQRGEIGKMRNAYF